MVQERREGGQNLWLLLVALGLGLVVVVIYNVHIYRVRQEGKGQTIQLIRVMRDMEPGDKITPKDIKLVPVDKRFQGSLGKVVTQENYDYVIGSPINQIIGKDEWLLWGHVTRQDLTRPSKEISRGFVAVTIPMDARMALGTILSAGDRVNVLGMLSVDGKPLQAYRIIDAVRVLAIGGVGPDPDKATRGSRSATGGAKTYRSVSIEVTPEVSLQLSNIFSRVVGGCWLELCSPNTNQPANAGQVNRGLQKLTAQPGRAMAPAGGPGADE